MSDESAALREVHTPLFWKCGVLLMAESADVCESEILSRVMAGSYDKPFIREHEEVRYLHFDMHTIQSAMRLDDPFALDLAYTRKMMAFMLFAPAPREVLQLGLGGGSLAKYCYRNLPQTRIRVVEIDAEVIALRDRFMIPADDERLRVIHGDGAEYVSDCPGPVDVLAIDAFDRKGLAPSLSSRAFYKQARRCLSPKGMLVMNLAGERPERQAHAERIRDAFGGAVIRIGLEASMNCVVFAFNDTSFDPDWDRIETDARALKATLGLDFPQYARRLKRTHQGAGARSLHGNRANRQAKPA